MNTHTTVTTILLISVVLSFINQCLAHSGVTIVANRVRDDIRIDGDLSDWPKTKAYELSVPYLFDGKPNTEDYTGRFHVACDYDREVLYVGVEIADDYINLDSPDDMWNSRDICEVFLTLEHSREQSVPLQFVYRKEPIVAEADKRKEELQKSLTAARGQGDNKLIYEWRIDLASLPGGKGSTQQPAVLGFDVGYVDLDKEGDIAVFSSSPGRAKHLSSATLADLVLPAKADALVSVAGEVKLPPTASDETGGAAKPNFPPVAIQATESSRFYVQVSCNEDGRYWVSLPPGKYTASLIDTPSARVSEKERVTFKVPSGNATTTIPTLQVWPLAKPDLVNETGLLLREGFDAEQVDRFVRAYMEFHSIPGISLAIVKEGEVVYGKGFGVKSLASGDPVTESTVFEVASMTKPMFAYAVCRLAERGVIDLDKPLWEYLPYEDIQHDDRYKKITARMVLCHRTGFPNWRDEKLKIHFEPGTQQRYSGEAYGYLAQVVSQLTGKDQETLMSDEVFSPLRIENTYLTWDTSADDSLVAMPHDRTNTTLAKSRWSEVWVAGCLHVDATNFAKFIRAIIHQEGLSPASYAEMLRPQVEIPEGSDDQNFSLGFVIGDSEFGKCCGHGGHNTGFTSAFEAYLDQKCGYVFMVNNYQAPKFHEDLQAFLITGKKPEPQLSRVTSPVVSSLAESD